MLASDSSNLDKGRKHRNFAGRAYFPRFEKIIDALNPNLYPQDVAGFDLSAMVPLAAQRALEGPIITKVRLCCAALCLPAPRRRCAFRSYILSCSVRADRSRLLNRV